ncbi:hypothetical protein E4T38_08133 [Aureobasidium subglaciale]|nr:hypothetical protein E4T38_08133 [Aureobasidium subglaciale]KAI5215863.1 hypothetical protein E4T40_08143 [Aureobasidium subglaciale]KAI5219183.1 hypothetical protein E4T41_08047 [Aureobasidium subglaciale]KAI5256626.1 hypothetical protein E4T46_08034 [Aureobasidium subglaciale]
MARHNDSQGKKASNPSKKPLLTHFLCIPLVNSTSQPQLEASISKFKEDVCTASPDTVSIAESTVKDGIAQEDRSPKNIGETTTPKVQAPMIPEQAIRPPGSLHLTLGVMSLDEGKLSQATTLLQSLDVEKLLREATPDRATEPRSGSESLDGAEMYLSTHPLSVSLSSLEPVQSPTKTSILYIRPEDPTNRLFPLCSALRNTFIQAGLLVPDTRPLNLHATIVNTIYIKGRKKKKATSKPASDTEKTRTTEMTKSTKDEEGKEGEIKANTPSSGHGPSAKSSLYIDASTLLPRYKTYIWASDILISKLAICEMGTKKQFDSTGKCIGEAYAEIAILEF